MSNNKIQITRIESTVTATGRKIARYQFPDGSIKTYEECLTIYGHVQPNDIDPQTWLKRGRAKLAARYQVRSNEISKWNAGDIAKEILTDKLVRATR
jgi:hypothetical protein